MQSRSSSGLGRGTHGFEGLSYLLGWRGDGKAPAASSQAHCKVLCVVCIGPGYGEMELKPYAEVATRPESHVSGERM